MKTGQKNYKTIRNNLQNGDSKPSPVKKTKTETKNKKQTDPTICCLQETHLSFKDMLKLIMKGLKRCPIQIETKRKGSYTYIRQNGL